MTLLNTLNSLDLAMFLRINGQPNAPLWLIVPAYFLAIQLMHLLALGLAGTWCWGNARQRRMVLQLLFAIAAVLLITEAIGMAWPRPRPFVMGVGYTFFHHAPTPSFPSNHAGIIWTCALVLLANASFRAAGWLLLVLGLGVAWARVFLGVHFPLDMVGAFLTALVTWRLTSMAWPLIEEPVFRLTLRAYHLLFAYPIAWKWVRD